MKTIALTKIQKLIGERMLKSKQTKPCFYISKSADITELMAMRPKLRKTLGIKITTNAFYIRVLAAAAEKYPLMLGRLEVDNIKIADSINVGFAVSAPQGLIVPVVQDADKKSLAEIARLEKLLTEKARDNKLTLTEIEGETIALSNLGAYATDSFLGIVPLPTSTILAVGNVMPTVCPRDDQATVRKIVTLSLAVDRRVIDELYAARFLNCIAEQLQAPKRLI